MSQMPWLFEEPTLAVKYSGTVRSNAFQVITAMTLNKYFRIKTLTCWSIFTCSVTLWHAKVFHSLSRGENFDVILKAPPKTLVPYLGKVHCQPRHQNWGKHSDSWCVTLASASLAVKVAKIPGLSGPQRYNNSYLVFRLKHTSSSHRCQSLFLHWKAGCPTTSSSRFFI